MELRMTSSRGLSGRGPLGAPVRTLVTLDPHLPLRKSKAHTTTEPRAETPTSDHDNAADPGRPSSVLSSAVAVSHTVLTIEHATFRLANTGDFPVPFPGRCRRVYHRLPARPRCRARRR